MNGADRIDVTSWGGSLEQRDHILAICEAWRIARRKVDEDSVTPEEIAVFAKADRAARKLFGWEDD